MRKRSVGLGVMGFDSFVQAVNVPWESVMAKGIERFFRRLLKGLQFEPQVNCDGQATGPRGANCCQTQNTDRTVICTTARRTHIGQLGVETG